tara:strand:- start:10319 stop:10756 length:438 start_codon:yes stop_codon:yes gene_type:complete
MMLSVASFGQKDDFHKRIKALKVSFITEQLQLTPKEAEVFWPIYNAYDEKMDDLRHEERDLWRKLYKEKGVKADLTENEADKLVSEYNKIEETRVSLQSKLLNDLRGKLTLKKVVYLPEVEQDFGKKLFEEYKKRKEQEKGKNTP